MSLRSNYDLSFDPLPDTNYKIILDEQALIKFTDWLPDLLPSETYYVCLFARKKYSQSTIRIRFDKEQMKRFTSKKETLISKLKQLECPIGSYTNREGESIPQEALVPYLTVNPRCLVKAGKESLKRLADLVTRPYEGWNPHQEIMSEIQKSCGRKLYIDFDFDVENDDRKREIYLKIRDVVGTDAVYILSTRGGFHCLVHTGQIQEKYKKTWYQNITAIEGCDVRGDNMIPIPGCTQGGYQPSLWRMVGYDGDLIWNKIC